MPLKVCPHKVCDAIWPAVVADSAVFADATLWLDMLALVIGVPPLILDTSKFLVLGLYWKLVL